MKKIFTSILILVSVVSFSACNFTKFDGKGQKEVCLLLRKMPKTAPPGLMNR